eukprot:COSAG01_NODE_32129_length_586_cov_0.642710_2_plen_21_part_01
MLEVAARDLETKGYTLIPSVL